MDTELFPVKLFPSNAELSDLLDKAYQEWIGFDVYFGTAAAFTEDEICIAALAGHSIQEQKADDNDNHDGRARSTWYIIEALNELRRRVQTRADMKGWQKHYQYEQFIIKMLNKYKKSEHLTIFLN